MKTIGTFALLLTAGILLAGCGEEETASAPEAEPPAVTEEAPRAEEPAGAEEEQQSEPPPEPGQEQATEEAAREIREAAEATGRAVREGAQRLAEQGRQALEDAAPALDRAAEIAGKLGASVGELVEQAQRDFREGVDLLERRLAEETGGGVTPTGGPETALAPEAELDADTRAAAQASAAGVGPAYVGVWAGEPAACAKIDQEPVEQFAVITTSTLRRHEALCNFAPAEMTEGNVVLDASCVTEGMFEERRITLDLSEPDRLSIGTPDAPESAMLVRCHLPR